MAWTQNGINYICQKYGDASQCVVSSGLIFNVIDVQGVTQNNQTGGTADIVALVLFNMITSITMVSPSRPAITNPNNALQSANGESLYATDSQTVTAHNETAGSQWCYSTVECTAGETKCINGFINECVDGAWSPTTTACTTTCEGQPSKELCEDNGCHWYPYPNPLGDPQCWDEPFYIKYLPFIAVGLGAIIVIGALASGGQEQPYYYYPRRRRR